MRLSREFFIPANSKPLADDASDAVAYLYRTAGTIGCVMFYGKQSKPVFHWTSRKDEAVARWIAEAFAARRQHARYVAGVRADRKAPHGLKVGDVFATCWGYDQTNVEHYEITALHGATMATVRRIAQHVENTGAMQGKCAPDFGNFIGEPVRVKLSRSGFSIDGHHASKVDVTEVAGVKVGKASSFTAWA